MQKRNLVVVLATTWLSVVSACGAVTPEPTATSSPPGAVRGRVVFAEKWTGGSTEPVGSVMIVLCQVPEEGLPEGPDITEANKDEGEYICSLQAMPTALTDPGGVFTLSDVSPATYLVMFRLLPATVDEQDPEWDGFALTQPGIDTRGYLSGRSRFWEGGGDGAGRAHYDLARGGLVVQKGTYCSNELSLCFSIRDERVHPVIRVEPNKTVEVELTTYLRAKDRPALWLNEN